MGSSTRNQRSARNLVYGLCKQLFILLLNFAVKTVFIKTLGKDFLGLNGLFSNIFLLFSFAEFGLGAAMTYSFYGPFARGEREKCRQLYHYFRRMYRAMSLLVLGLGMLVIPLMPYLVDLDLPMTQVVAYYLLYILSSCVSNWFLYQANVLVADQNQYLVSRIQLILETACFLLQIVVLIWLRSFALYLACVVIKFLITGVCYQVELRRQYPYLEQKAVLPRAERAEILENTKTLFVYKFARALINSTDNLLISVLVGTVWIGLYSNYQFVVVGVQGLVSALFSAFTASVGNLVAQRIPQAQYRVYRAVDLIDVWVSGFTAACLLALFQDFIALWAGVDYLLDLPAVILIVAIYYLRVIREGICMFREAAGLFTPFKNVTLITAALNLVLSVILGRAFGLIGIFAATVVAILATYFWYEPYLTYKRLFHRPFGEYVKRQAAQLAVTLAVVGVTCWLCALLPAASVGGFIGKMALCAVVPNALFYLIYRRTEEFGALMDTLRDLWRHRTGKGGEQHHAAH
ncbi:MAG: hypothetical protein ACOYJA_06200 [Christensenellales bacterium]|jgi:O-antigen/teichoic acid export membrane protein